MLTNGSDLKYIFPRRHLNVLLTRLMVMIGVETAQLAESMNEIQQLDKKDRGIEVNGHQDYPPMRWLS